MGDCRPCPLMYPRRGSTLLTFNCQERVPEATCLETRKVVADALRHGIRKGLMTSQGPITPPLLPLLEKDKEYVVDNAHSIVRDVDLDECSKHKTDLLGDFGLFDMMMVCCISISIIPF